MPDNIDGDLRVAAQLFLKEIKAAFSEHPFDYSMKPSNLFGFDSIEIMVSFTPPVPHPVFMKGKRTTPYSGFNTKEEEPVEVKKISFHVYNMEDKAKKLYGKPFKIFMRRAKIKDKQFELMIFANHSEIIYNKKIPKGKKLSDDMTHPATLWWDAIDRFWKGAEPLSPGSAHEYLKLLSSSMR